MSIRLGSKLTTNLPLAEYLKKATGHFRAIELPTDPKHLSPFFTYTSSQKSAIRIYQKLFQFHLSMHAPFVDCRLGAINPEERQLAIIKILNAMQLASNMEIELLTFHPCTLEPSAPDKYADNCCFEEDSIAYLLKEAKKLGVVLLMENMPQLPAYHPSTCNCSRFQELLWLFPEPQFGITLDIGHALQANVPLDSFLLLERVRNFHIHENNRVTDCHQPIVTNLTWWRKLTASLAKKYPDAVLIFEMDQLTDQIKSQQLIKYPSSKNRRVQFLNVNLEELAKLSQEFLD
ncbi:MAG TPA: sugar phosphate isomerase/epimerase family protein [Bacillota bacterium]|nr:sugar phosphate isomerase/epimerase family protein [Bacillota bacterium]